MIRAADEFREAIDLGVRFVGRLVVEMAAAVALGCAVGLLMDWVL